MFSGLNPNVITEKYKEEIHTLIGILNKVIEGEELKRMNNGQERYRQSVIDLKDYISRLYQVD